MAIYGYNEATKSYGAVENTPENIAITNKQLALTEPGSVKADPTSNSGYSYTSAKPATAPTNPTNPTTPNADGYYPRLPGVSDQQLTDAQDAQYKVTDPNEAYKTYSSDMLANQQARIDEINKLYSEKLTSELAQQEPANKNALGRTNALSSLMGLSGSSSADTRTAVTERSNATINQGIVSKVNAEKIDKLNQIYDKIDTGATEMYKAQLETNKENQKALLEASKNNALSNLQAIAQTVAETGKTFDDWKNSDSGDTLSKIMAQTSQSEYQIRQAWKNALPEQYKPITTTTYHDDGKGGTIMQQVEFDPVTKKSTVNSYPIAVPVSTFQTAEKPIEGKNGELFVKQADGTYKDMSPNADNLKYIEATKYQKSGYIDPKTGKFTALESVGGTGNLGNGSGSDLSGKIVDPQTVQETVSNSILSATGLSKLAFDYLTQGTSALTRMGEATRKQVIQEAENYANQNGVDVATFKSQYEGLSKTVGANVLRNNQAATAEAELDATLKNVKEAVNEAGFGDVKIANVVNKWAKGEINDAEVARYNFHLNQLVEEFAMYNAAIAGQIDANGNIRQLTESDLSSARSIIQSGAAKGTIDGFESALKASMEKMGVVLKASIDAQNKQVWNLFGVGEKYDTVKQQSNNKKLVSQVNEAIEQKKMKGVDGKLAPWDYNGLKQIWINQGGSADSFDKEYSNLKNPNNPNY